MGGKLIRDLFDFGKKKTIRKIEHDRIFRNEGKKTRYLFWRGFEIKTWIIVIRARMFVGYSRWSEIQGF